MADRKLGVFAETLAARVAGIPADECVTVLIDGSPFKVPAGCTVAAAIALTAEGVGITRRSVGGMLRAPVCGMGVCQECRVGIDGYPYRLACQTLCAPGMHIDTAQAAA